MVGVIGTQIGMAVFEILMLIIGISVMFLKVNQMQIFVHILGIIFTAWFLMDQWKYTNVWFMFAMFSLVPFLLECSMIVQASQFNKNIKKNIYS
mmetsp:Transcript_430/g.235  ORF Transcript_430/g.235 Transcript_430/m.235 type:complete len:94 (-) Transcript_430:12-293(-)